ncbi:hypothetical protein V498_03446, partial [Pseudogymnoascus sp. VKM F-4517 (FW-2822)]
MRQITWALMVHNVEVVRVTVLLTERMRNLRLVSLPKTGSVKRWRLKMVTETFKYYPTLTTGATSNHSGQPASSSELSSCDDAVLTALAQAGLFQTGTDRSLISLFDADQQYVVAEATPSSPLLPSVRSRDCRQPLWLLGTSIPRSHGVCKLSLLGETDGQGILDFARNPTVNPEPYAGSMPPYPSERDGASISASTVTSMKLQARFPSLTTMPKNYFQPCGDQGVLYHATSSHGLVPPDEAMKELVAAELWLVGDFITAIELANKIRKEFVDAPSQFKAVSAEIRGLSIVLQDADVAFPKQ